MELILKLIKMAAKYIRHQLISELNYLPFYWTGATWIRDVFSFVTPTVNAITIPPPTIPVSESLICTLLTAFGMSF